MGNFMTILPLILLLVVMYFLLIRPQKKKEKEIKAMRDSINVGDEIITIGGICAKVVKTKEESLIVQVGADKVKFEMMRWSVSSVVSEGKGTAPAADEEEKKSNKPKRLGKKAEETETEAQAEPTEAATENTEEKTEE